MKESKRKSLEAAGWAVGSADEFLGLSSVESLLVDLRLALSQALKERRARLHISQTALAGLIKSSQSRVAKMEAADPEVSFELLLRGLFATGATRRDVASVLDQPRRGKRLGVTPRSHGRGQIGVEDGAGEVAAGRRRTRGRSRTIAVMSPRIAPLRPAGR
jgi:transcriptional regulator with XRE-family HTH domain